MDALRSILTVANCYVPFAAYMTLPESLKALNGKYIIAHFLIIFKANRNH